MFILLANPVTGPPAPARSAGSAPPAAPAPRREPPTTCPGRSAPGSRRSACVLAARPRAVEAGTGLARGFGGRSRLPGTLAEAVQPQRAGRRGAEGHLPPVVADAFEAEHPDGLAGGCNSFCRGKICLFHGRRHTVEALLDGRLALAAGLRSGPRRAKSRRAAGILTQERIGGIQGRLAPRSCLWRRKSRRAAGILGIPARGRRRGRSGQFGCGCHGRCPLRKLLRAQSGGIVRNIRTFRWMRADGASAARRLQVSGSPRRPGCPPVARAGVIPYG